MLGKLRVHVQPESVFSFAGKRIRFINTKISIWSIIYKAVIKRRPEIIFTPGQVYTRFKSLKFILFHGISYAPCDNVNKRNHVRWQLFSHYFYFLLP